MSLAVEGPQQFFDDVVDHMATNCNAPISVVVLSEGRRQWLSGQNGAKGGEADPKETYDARALMGVEKTVVNDTDMHPAFPRDSIDAQRSAIRAFIAQPMRHNGELVGHIYLADTKPREWSPSEISYMERSERLMVAQTEARAIIAERDRRIALEHELNEVGDLYRTVVSNMTEGVVVVSAEGAIVAANAVALEALGVSGESIQGKSPADPQWNPLREDGSPLPPEENPVMRALATGEDQLGVIAGIDRVCGGRRWLEINSVPIFAAGADRPYQVATTFRDITEKRAQDARLEKACAEAERAAVSKQQFLANMSHEIRTPLNGVVGLAQALRMTELDAEQEDLVATILESGGTLMTLLNDVLDLSKIEAGKFEIVRAEQDIGEFMRRQSQLWKPRAEEKGLRLSVSIDADLSKRLSFDPVRVQQCLNNLLSNAVKFTSSGEVALSIASRTLPDSDHLVEVRVRDTGIGMDDVALARLFQPFMQADETISRVHGGTGLGLSITRKLAELMGGEATATSCLGKGSEFVISFRASPASHGSSTAEPTARPGPAEAAADSLGGRNLRVLVVDDNAVNRQVAVLFLKPLNVTTVEATNGEEALLAMQSEAFDLVLLDMHMPVLDGPGTIARIRASRAPWSSTPVMAVTADAMSGDKERYLAMGLDGYLAKPLGARDLRSEMGRILGLAVNDRLAMTG